jgi:hypothetical protein
MIDFDKLNLVAALLSNYAGLLVNLVLIAAWLLPRIRVWICRTLTGWPSISLLLKLDIRPGRPAKPNRQSKPRVKRPRQAKRAKK